MFPTWFTFIIRILYAQSQYKGTKDGYNWDTMKINSIPPVLRKPIKVYRKINTKHEVVAKGKDFVKIPGLQQIVEITNDGTECHVTVHSHGHVHDPVRRLDLEIFVNDKACGIGGSINSQDWVSGTGVSRNPQWIPIISFCSVTLNKGSYVIEAAIRNVHDNGQVNSNGNGMIIQVFEPNIIDYKWIDVDIDDKQFLFDKDAEYRIEIIGTQWVYPISVSQRKIMIMFMDDDNGEIYQNGVIKAYDKRSVYTKGSCLKSYVTKIQVRKINN